MLNIHHRLPQSAAPQVMKLQDQDIKAGRIEYETGSVEVEVAFTVLLFRPFRNEIIDAQVTTVTEVGGSMWWLLGCRPRRKKSRLRRHEPVLTRRPPPLTDADRWASSPTQGPCRASTSINTYVVGGCNGRVRSTWLIGV